MKMNEVEKKQKIFQSLQLENNKHTDNQLVAQTEVMEMINTKLDRLEEEGALLLESNADKEEDIDSLKRTLNSIREQIDGHTSLMESLDNLHNLNKNNNESGLEQTLQTILKINHENKELIRNIEKKERDPKSYDDNRERNFREDLVLVLQKQISSLQANFEEMKQKIFNNYNSRETGSSNIMDMQGEGMKYTFSKLSHPDLESLVQSFEECRDKLNNLEAKFENVKDVTGISNGELGNKMIKIIEQLNSLMIKVATLEEKTRQIDLACGDMNGKLSNLESADVFLQEADRMIIEKMSRIDKDAIEENLKSYVDENVLSLTKRVNEQWTDVRDEMRDKQNIVPEAKYQTSEKQSDQHKTRGVDIVQTNLLQSEDKSLERPAGNGDSQRLWSALLELYAAFSKFSELLVDIRDDSVQGRALCW